jgi:hypothetical protein
MRKYNINVQSNLGTIWRKMGYIIRTQLQYLQERLRYKIAGFRLCIFLFPAVAVKLYGALQETIYMRKLSTPWELWKNFIQGIPYWETQVKNSSAFIHNILIYHSRLKQIFSYLWALKFLYLLQRETI